MLTMATAHRTHLFELVVRTLPSTGSAIAGLCLGVVIGNALLRCKPDARKLNLMIIGLLFVSCTSLAAGRPSEGESVAIGTRLKLLIAELIWVGLLRVAFSRLQRGIQGWQAPIHEGMATLPAATEDEGKPSSCHARPG